MRYAYYPGCSAESTARDMHQSTLAVAGALGIEMIEPKGWTCCGATAATRPTPYWPRPYPPQTWSMFGIWGWTVS